MSRYFCHMMFKQFQSPNTLLHSGAHLNGGVGVDAQLTTTVSSCRDTVAHPRSTLEHLSTREPRGCAHLNFRAPPQWRSQEESLPNVVVCFHLRTLARRGSRSVVPLPLRSYACNGVGDEGLPTVVAFALGKWPLCCPASTSEPLSTREPGYSKLSAPPRIFNQTPSPRESWDFSHFPPLTAHRTT